MPLRLYLHICIQPKHRNPEPNPYILGSGFRVLGFRVSGLGVGASSVRALAGRASGFGSISDHLAAKNFCDLLHGRAVGKFLTDDHTASATSPPAIAQGTMGLSSRFPQSWQG